MDGILLGVVDFLVTFCWDVYRTYLTGRTVHEFIFCVIVIPMMVGIVWMGAFGGTAVSQVMADAAMGCSAFDELDYFKLNPASFGLAGRNENKLCCADYGAEESGAPASVLCFECFSTFWNFLEKIKTVCKKLLLLSNHYIKFLFFTAFT